MGRLWSDLGPIKITPPQPPNINSDQNNSSFTWAFHCWCCGADVKLANKVHSRPLSSWVFNNKVFNHEVFNNKVHPRPLNSWVFNREKWYRWWRRWWRWGWWLWSGCGGDDLENEFERVLKGSRITYIGKPWHLGKSRVNRVNKVGGVAVGHLLKQTRSHKATCSAQMDQLEHSSKITIFPRSSSTHNSTFWVQWRSRWTRT